MQRRTQLQSILGMRAKLTTVPASRAHSVRLRPPQSTPLAVYRQWASDALYPQLKLNDDIEVHWRDQQLGHIPRKANIALGQMIDGGETLNSKITRLGWSYDSCERVGVRWEGHL